ncbi:hypothetical protein PMI09_00666 [Rhizobium sp. CF122]|uniref:hypothetical protein n=1 Tax=Rhizobium sp. CF122 TaxID=1144312 RepID=UPI000271A01C|nr:hypothetical protein [Rhizobium sp. CF122]EJL57961.1 hypothetical protein PMI09_00666 [Rhizobium sp. CF122]
MIKAILIKPLDGDPAGSTREFSPEDFRRLEAYGAVRKAGADEAKKAPTAKDKRAPAVVNKAVDK